jgi:hypothetical protein
LEIFIVNPLLPDLGVVLPVQIEAKMRLALT